PCHQQPQFLGRHRRRTETGDLALVHDRDPVREGVDLVEFGGDDEHGHALVALFDDAAVHELDRAHVQPAGGLATSTLCSRPSSLARMTFCWLPPDSVPTGASTEVVRTSNSFTRSAALLAMASRLSLMPDAYGGRSYVSSTMLSATGKSPISPSSCRSSGT